MTARASAGMRILAAVLLIVSVSGCGSTEQDDDQFDSLLGRLNAGDKSPSRAGGGGWGGLAPSSGGPVTFDGTGGFVSSRAPAVSVEPSPLGGQGYRLNLVDAPIAAAAKYILGDTLGLNYVVDPNAAGTITLQTSAPVSRDSLIDIFETTLASNGLAIVQTGGVYRIVQANDAITGTPPVSVPSVASRGPGVKILVVQLRYISAEEMRNILSPISRSGAILRFDPDRNYLMLAGTNAELLAMQDAISVFDVDWMRGMSVALHPLTTSRPTEIAKELETIFRTSDGPGTSLIRFVPNEQLNSILVVTSQPGYLQRAAEWIQKLDRVATSSEAQVFVYPIQNRRADELAKVLQAVLSQQSGDSAVSPDLLEVEVSTDVAALDGASDSPIGTGSTVVADPENNALLIYATSREYAQIEPILRRLDLLPTQVMLEAVIAEVTLNDDLRFGVRWFLENGGGARVSLSGPRGGTGPIFPGLNWTFASSDMRLTLNALADVTDVKVISSPTLMALNNQEAVLQIGDQVPIATQTATSVTDPGAPIVNSVELKDTGIILRVTPRVNSAGGVLLDIEQEASRVVVTTSSGIDSPTIQQRKISTRVVVNDGEALVLGGLIQDDTSQSRSGVPVLMDIPFLGAVFRSKTDKIARTELLIFVRPNVVRNYQDAQSANDEFRQRLSLGRPESIQTKLVRDLQRLR